MIKKLFFILSAAVCLASCSVTNDESAMTVFGTVVGNKTSGYTIYRDGGGIITPVTSSMGTTNDGSDITTLSNRGMFYVSYTDDCLTDKGNNTYVIDGASVTGGVMMPVRKPLTLEEAGKAKLNDPDSSFAVTYLSGLWGYRGYITSMITANVYSGPDAKSSDFTLVYDPDQNKENELDLTLIYNARCSKDAALNYRSDFYFSYDISSLAGVPAGSDSVKVNMYIEGLGTKSFKIGREDFSASNYVPFTGTIKNKK